MASHNSYSIPILNELHNLYPEILYRPSQFQTSDDIIQYILDRGVQRRFRQESERYQQREQYRARLEEREQAQRSQRNPPRHRPSIEQFEFEIYNEVPSISSILQPNSSNSSNPSSLEQLVSYFINVSANAAVAAADNSSAIIRPTSEQLSASTSVDVFVSSTESYECAICQDGLQEGQMARRIHHCSHVFHQRCIDTWFETHATCPTCRHDIRE